MTKVNPSTVILSPSHSIAWHQIGYAETHISRNENASQAFKASLARDQERERNNRRQQQRTGARFPLVPETEEGRQVYDDVGEVVFCHKRRLLHCVGAHI